MKLTPEQRKASVADFCRLRDAQPRDERAYQRAKARVVKENSGLVWTIARAKSRGMRASFEDAAQCGFLGLLRALEDFDPSLGWTLSPYARTWIVGKIKEWKGADTTIHKPDAVYQRHRKIQRVRFALMAEFGREPTRDEIAKATGFKLRHIKLDRETQWVNVSADEPVVSHGARSFERKVFLIDRAVADVPSAEEEMTREESKREVRELLKGIPARTLLVLLRRFAEEEETFESIGNDLELSRERVRQIEKQGLDMMRERARRRQA